MENSTVCAETYKTLIAIGFQGIHMTSYDHINVYIIFISYSSFIPLFWGPKWLQQETMVRHLFRGNPIPWPWRLVIC